MENKEDILDALEGIVEKRFCKDVWISGIVNK